MGILDNEGHDPNGLFNQASWQEIGRLRAENEQLRTSLEQAQRSRDVWIDVNEAAGKTLIEMANLLRGALDWFSSHEVESKLGHLPQWVVLGWIARRSFEQRRNTQK